MRLYRDNKAPICIAQNPAQQHRTKHEKIEKQLRLENIDDKY